MAKKTRAVLQTELNSWKACKVGTYLQVVHPQTFTLTIQPLAIQAKVLHSFTYLVSYPGSFDPLGHLPTMSVKLRDCTDKRNQGLYQQGKFP